MDENRYELPPMRPAKRQALNALLDHVLGQAIEACDRIYRPTLARQRALDELQQLKSIDPSSTARYIPYLCHLYLQSDAETNLRLLYEDNHKVSAYLWAVDVLRQGRIPLQITSSNINAAGMTSHAALMPPELFQAIEPFRDRLVRSPAYQSITNIFEQPVLDQIQLLVTPKSANPVIDLHGEAALLAGDNPSAQILHDDAVFKFVKINDRHAARFYGRDTEWCTAWAHTHTHADRYLKDGPLYVISINGNGRIYQLQISPWQLMNHVDSPQKLPWVINNLPEASRGTFASILIEQTLNERARKLEAPVVAVEMDPYLTNDHRQRMAELHLKLALQPVKHGGAGQRDSSLKYLRSSAVRLNEADKETYVHFLDSLLKGPSVRPSGVLVDPTPVDRLAFTPDQRQRMLKYQLATSRERIKQIWSKSPDNQHYTNLLYSKDSNQRVFAITSLDSELERLSPIHHEQLIASVEAWFAEQRAHVSEMFSTYTKDCRLFSMPHLFSDAHAERMYNLAEVAQQHGLYREIRVSGAGGSREENDYIADRLNKRRLEICHLYPQGLQRIMLSKLEDQARGRLHATFGVISPLLKGLSDLSGNIQDRAAELAFTALDQERTTGSLNADHCMQQLVTAAPKLSPAFDDRLVPYIVKDLRRNYRRSSDNEEIDGRSVRVEHPNIASVTIDLLGSWYGTRLHDRAVDLIVASHNLSRPVLHTGLILPKAKIGRLAI